MSLFLYDQPSKTQFWKYYMINRELYDLGCASNEYKNAESSGHSQKSFLLN